MELKLGGGFKHFLFSPLFGEDFQLDEHIFEMGGSTTNQEILGPSKLRSSYLLPLPLGVWTFPRF